MERIEPSGKSSVIASPSMFQNPKDKTVWMTDVDEFELKGDFMFTIKEVSQVRFCETLCMKFAKSDLLILNFLFSE